MSKPARPRPASPQIVDPPAGRPSAPSAPPPPARLRSRLARRLGRLAAVATGIVVLSVLNESRLEAADTTQYPPAGRLVGVGGGRMHLNCTGKGSPTVVIDAGLGDWSMTWHAVQTGVARTTRVCTYDRAGMGNSDPGPLPRDASSFASELHTLLEHAGVTGPYVMVGHSLGGLTARVFAHRYRQDVAGLVLIESMSPPPVNPGASLPPPPAAGHATPFSFYAFAARLGLVRGLAGPLGLVDGITPENADAYVTHLVRPTYFQTVSDEMVGLAASLAEAREVTTLGDLPLTVLSRGQDLEPTWQAGQQALLTLSSQSNQVIAEHSGHGIEWNQPGAAVDAIVDVVQRVR